MLSNDQLETKLEASPAPRVTPQRLDEVIKKSTFYTHGLLTFCVLDLANGFIVTGESACVSPANYNKEVVEKIAFDNARRKVLALEGYALKQQLYEVA
jgi:hypothetical protein